MRDSLDLSPFIFPSTHLSYPLESTPSSPSSLNSPYKSSSSVPRPPVSQSSSVHLPTAVGPCAACKILRRQCTEKCYLATYFPSDQANKLAVVDTVSGSGDIVNFLQQNSNSSYIPLLLVLRDTTEDEEIQSHPKNKDHNFNQLGTSINSDHFSTNAIIEYSRNDFSNDVSLGDNSKHHKQQLSTPIVSQSLQVRRMERVKLYRLNENGKWDDQGTGHVFFHFSEILQNSYLTVIDKEDGKVILVHRILRDDIFRKEEDTIISWRDETWPAELALSFQEIAGCSYLWDRICAAQWTLQTIPRPIMKLFS